MPAPPPFPTNQKLWWIDGAHSALLSNLFVVTRQTGGPLPSIKLRVIYKKRTIRFYPYLHYHMPFSCILIRLNSSRFLLKENSNILHFWLSLLFCVRKNIETFTCIALEATLINNFSLTDKF